MAATATATHRRDAFGSLRIDATEPYYILRIRTMSNGHASLPPMARTTSRPKTRPMASVDDTPTWRPQQATPTSLLFDVYVLGQRARALVADAMREAGLR